MARKSKDTVQIEIPRDLFEDLRQLAVQAEFQREELTILLLRRLVEMLQKEGRLRALVADERTVPDEMIDLFMDRYDEALQKLAR